MAVEKVSKERSKVVLRHIPPGFTSESLLQLLTETLSPFPQYDFFHFAPADFSLAPYLSCRAYFNFVIPESALVFKDKFDGQKFIDTNKIQSVGIVEYAPFQRVPKRLKKDVRSATLEKDPDFLEFLVELKIEPEAPPSIETIIDEIEKRRAARAEEQSSTALLEYIKTRRAERSLSPGHCKPQYGRRDRSKMDDRDMIHNRYKGSRPSRGRNNSEEEQSHEFRRKSHTDNLDGEKHSARGDRPSGTSRRANDEFRTRNNVKSDRGTKSFATKGKPEKEIYVPGKKKAEEPAKYILSSNKDPANREKTDPRASKESTSSDTATKSYRDRAHCEERSSYRREGYDGDNKEKEYRREGPAPDADRKEYRRGENFEADKDRDREERDTDYYSDYRGDRGAYRGSSYRGARGYSRGGWRDDRSRGRGSRSRARSSTRGHS